VDDFIPLVRLLWEKYGREGRVVAVIPRGGRSLGRHPHLVNDPVELNTADRRDLLRVPGIGPVGAEKLLRERRRGRLRDLSDLRQLGIAT